MLTRCPSCGTTFRVTPDQLKVRQGQVNPAVEARIRRLRAKGMGILKIGRTLDVGTSVVQRVVGKGGL